ncbi:MotA/TolQ/ExbB proton channel family protein [Methanobrevibacter sp.]|uniref:MotA/TolQ/ExbB proton channel family protein n=1 Tax=Methanobrevibacter sp. TaxID=66852 RepID=UPI0026006960|nr:MotA/TolQ/ExbB proton channel family protein [Methanobrevibacter sp.]MBQ2961625.1 MotA/TolQ/ExbB proton channel family protein [Methanobrevibacter sp.]
MVTIIPGSDLLTSALNVIAQSLQIPVIIFLLAFAVFAVYIIGSLISEYSSHKKVPVKLIRELIYRIANCDVNDLQDIIKNAPIQHAQKVVLMEIARAKDLREDTRRALARKLFEEEQDKIEKNLQKTDIVTKIGPTLGLMGTLIPMGPGLAALGSGDVNTLASAIIVAFDTTVVGIGAGAVAYVAGKIRRRWYEQYLSNLDALADTVLDRLKKEDEMRGK